ncbi:MAG TPA: S8 family peptidase, partial [Deltaproteobacteria bacterium]|nr:S8 family peptidase [Deltaproteobacteria bacterium]
MRKYRHFITLILAIFLLACLSDQALAGSRRHVRPDGLHPHPVTWYEGRVTRHAWMSTDEAALLVEPAPQSRTRARNSLSRIAPDAAVLADHGDRIDVRLGSPLEPRAHAARISRLRGAGGIRAALPVFYASPSPKAASKMLLTGRVLVRFKASTPPAVVAQTERTHGIRPLRSFPFAKNTFLYDAGDPMRGIEVSRKLARSGQVVWAYPDWIRTHAKRAIPDDPLFDQQWHLLNTGQSGGTSGQDVNIATVWDTYRGGTGEVIAIVDDGLEAGHADLSANVRTDLCWDFVDNDTDTTAGDHGTSCAGVAAGRGFNGTGITGAAPYARLVGHRILPESGGIANSTIADALSRNNSIIDIYSNSWGPGDGGDLLDGPSPLELTAMADSVSTGRGGRGSIYLWAGGNGGDSNDNSNYDGYANSRYVIAVAASTNQGVSAWYSEPGANILVNSPSNGGTLGITTTDRTGATGYSSTDYTSDFGGTSSATPLAAGIVALMLQANPDLTWRDVRAILALTARRNDPTSPGWTTNGAGRPIHYHYGFGRIDAQAAVSAALSWTNLAAEVSTQGTSSPNLPIPDNSAAGVTDTITVSRRISIEYVEVFFSAADHTFWPDLEVTLVSPEGTESVLAQTHSPSSASGSFDNWRFSTVRHLGEESDGVWTLRVRDLASQDTGTFQSWTLKIYGTSGDSAAPVISDLTVADLTDTTATVTWTTDEPASSLLRYGTASSPWEDYPYETGSTTLTTNHSVTLTGLLDNTTYSCRAGSFDSDGNGPGVNGNITNPSGELNFTTATDAPTISSVVQVMVAEVGDGEDAG